MWKQSKEVHFNDCRGNLAAWFTCVILAVLSKLLSDQFVFCESHHLQTHTVSLSEWAVLKSFIFTCIEQENLHSKLTNDNFTVRNQAKLQAVTCD